MVRRQTSGAGTDEMSADWDAMWEDRSQDEEDDNGETAVWCLPVKTRTTTRTIENYTTTGLGDEQTEDDISSAKGHARERQSREYRARARERDTTVRSRSRGRGSVSNHARRSTLGPQVSPQPSEKKNQQRRTHQERAWTTTSMQFSS